MCQLFGSGVILKSESGYGFNSLSSKRCLGEEVHSSDTIMTIKKMYSNKSIHVKSFLPEGYFFFLPKQKVLLSGKSLRLEELNLVYGVISSDPNDTLPEIKAWLAKHSIPFYQDR